MRIVIRPAVEADMAFIYATWLRGLYYGHPWFRDIDKDVFFAEYHKAVERLLAQSNSSIQIACLEEDPDTMLGYAVMRGPVLDWVFVKKAFRKFGIARMLVPASITTTTHLTKLGKTLMPEEWKFNPFI